MALTKAPMGLVLSVLSKILVLVIPADWQMCHNTHVSLRERY